MLKDPMDYISPEVGQVRPDDLSAAVALRVFDESDADDVMLWATDELATQYCRWEIYTCREQALEYIISNASHPYLRAICLNNRAIGAISVTANPGRDMCRAELGYILASCFWGKGIATRAVKLVCSRIFMEWPHLARLEALVEVENKASLKVLEKAGFKMEGVLRKYLILKGKARDMMMLSLLSTDTLDNDNVSTSAALESMQLCMSLERLNIR